MISFKRLIILLFATIFVANLEAQSVHSFAPNSVLAEGKWIKIAIDGKDDGVYEVSYSQLAKMGFRNPQNVGVYGFGGHVLAEDFSKVHIDDLPEIAVYNDADTKRILFYAQGLITWEYNATKRHFVHSQNPYSNKACYFLHEKNSASRTLDVEECGSDVDSVVTVFDAHLLHEQELVNLGKTGRELYGESFADNRSQTITFDEPLLPQNVYVSVNFVAQAPESTSFSVKCGNQDLGSARLRAATNSYVFSTEANLNKTFDLENEAKPTFRITYDTDITVKSANLNYIRVEGKQNLTIPSGKSFICFRNLEAQNSLLRYQLDEVGAIVWDVTDPINVKSQTLVNGNYFTATEKGLKEYVLLNPNGKQFPGVTVIGQVNNQNLHATEDVDFVIVTAPALKSYARRLADFRASHDKLKVKVVTTEEVYNEYSSGSADATAIRLYMKQVFGNRKNDGYLLLFGDGYYNNRKVENSQYYVVAYETSSSLVETSSTVCDDYFGFLDDNEGGRRDSEGRYNNSSDVVDIGIGRLTVHTNSDAEAVVNKIIDYSTNTRYGSWKNRLCFLSDDDKIADKGSDSPNVHMKHNDQVIDVIQKTQGHNEFVYQKIYLAAYSLVTTASGSDYPDAKKEFLEALQQGVLVVNYAGHGAHNSITHETMMTTSRATQLNMKNLPFWITASCDVSRWDDDDDSLGEALLVNHNGGAIGLISTTRVVYAQQNLTLNLAIARSLFQRKTDGSRYRLGDVIRETKQSLGSDYNKLNFSLLADPTMTLSYPDYGMEVTDIEYGDRITIRGRVLKPGSNETATDFNGLVYPTVYDAADSITADKGRHQDPIYKFSTRTKKIFSGRDVVKDGLFECSFITPKDVSTFSTDGLINLYACNENCEEANGYFDKLTVTRPDASAYGDNDGPEIRKVFVNSSDFANGDVVGSTPYFFAEVYDPSGFNATGNSVGHDVSLIVHCTSNTLLSDKQYVLNNYLTTYTGDPTSGNVRFPIPILSDGEYDLTFKIWDSMNNSSSTKIHIVVDGTLANHPLLVQAYPSPVVHGDNVTFRILHNLPESSTNIQLSVFSQTGTKVFETSVSTTASDVIYLNKDARSYTDINTAFNADETSEFVGASTVTWHVSVAPGIYIYKVKLSSGNSDATSESKILMVK